MPLNLTSQLDLSSHYRHEYLAFHQVLPLVLEAGRLRVAVVEPVDEDVLADLAFTYQAAVDSTVVSLEDLQDGLRRSYATRESLQGLVRDLDAAGGAHGPSPDGAAADLRELVNQPPVVRFVNLLVREAAEARASDIHLESDGEGLRVRFRIDGVLTDAQRPPRAIEAGVVSRLKLLADLDIAEHRLPQDGRFRVRLEHGEFDLRIAVVPTHFGESVVLRLLDQGTTPVDLTGLGMAGGMLQAFSRLVARSSGIVLVTGPTGSGKTTTLHGAVRTRPAHLEKIIAVEDPVEYELPGVTQVAINPKTGLTFPVVLRSLLRHDPDVLLIGETRDLETATIAVQAAMTGHLVISTLHTNDAAGAVPRLVDLGLESYLIAATLEGVLAQRLVRRLCPDCRVSYHPDPRAVALLSGRPAGEVALARGAGCPACRHTGYRGRTGLFELLVMTDPLREHLARGISLTRLRTLAREEGMQTLREAGWAKVSAGETTVEEVLRVVAP